MKVIIASKEPRDRSLLIKSRGLYVLLVATVRKESRSRNHAHLERSISLRELNHQLIVLLVGLDIIVKDLTSLHKLVNVLLATIVLKVLSHQPMLPNLVTIHLKVQPHRSSVQEVSTTI